jgi:cellulose synthase/poly-beta-1,6-N-acetylglucosamine synthase-like glycosyltransferase
MNFFDIASEVLVFSIFATFVSIVIYSLFFFFYVRIVKFSKAKTIKKGYLRLATIFIIISIPFVYEIYKGMHSIYALYEITNLFLFVFIGITTFKCITLMIFATLERHMRKGALQNTPLVSIIIPAHNEEKTIEKALNSIFKANYKKKEVIVIDDGSTDKTLEKLKKYSRKRPIKIISLKRSGKAKSLNVGIRKAKGEIVICMDADTIANKNTISNLVKFFNNPKIGAVTARIEITNKKGFITRSGSLEYDLYFLTELAQSFFKMTTITGAMTAFRKRALIEVGLFDHKIISQDRDITYKLLKAGYQTICCYDAKIYMNVLNNIVDVVKQRYRWDRGILQAMLKHMKARNLNELKYFLCLINKLFFGLNDALLYLYFEFFVSSWIAIFTLLSLNFTVFLHWFIFSTLMYAILIIYTELLRKRIKLWKVLMAFTYRLFFKTVIDILRILSQSDEVAQIIETREIITKLW